MINNWRGKIKKSIKGVFSFVIILMLGIQISESAFAFTYNDTRNHWARTQIDTISNILRTDAGGSYFYPNSSQKRGDFTMALMIYVYAIGEASGYQGDSPFTDVEDGTELAVAVNWAASNGIVEGMSPTYFGANESVTREALSTFLYRTCQSFGVSLPYTYPAVTFSDQSSISQWALNAVRRLQRAGIVSGYSDNTFRPQQTITKAEAYTALYNLKTILLDGDKGATLSNTVGCGFTDFGWASFTYTFDYNEYGIITGDNDTRYYSRTVDQETTCSRSNPPTTDVGLVIDRVLHKQGNSNQNYFSMDNNPDASYSSGLFAEEHLINYTKVALSANTTLTGSATYSIISTDILIPYYEVASFPLSR